MYLNDFCTVPMSLAGIPAISIPCGLAGDERGLGPDGAGLPVGFQLAGPAFSESRLLDAAYALERAFAFDGSPARTGGRSGRGGSRDTAAGAGEGT
jgi:aspartyl-tRNA(Asn)/glutamyl-tRNA(Gln) amidotransferase subunit A